MASLAAAILLCVVIAKSSGSRTDLHFSPDLLTEYGFSKDATTTEVIAAKIQLIKETPVSIHAWSDLQLLADQARGLDQHYLILLEDYKNNPREEELARAVLSYLQNKQALLDKIMRSIERIHQNEKRYGISSEKASLQL
jgi:hypothetical protein